MKRTLLFLVVSATAACEGPPETPVDELAAAQHLDPTVHRGNVVITTAAEAAAWQTVVKIVGDLTIADGLLEDVALPGLARVTGDLVVNYARPDKNFTSTRKVDLPALARVDGSVTLLSKNPPGPWTASLTVELGLPALTDVGCDLAISIEAFGVNITGLPALTALHHDLSIIGGDGDFAVYTAGLLPLLRKVCGDVTLDLGHNLFGALMPALTDVEGDFALVDGNPNPPSLAALARVDGNMLIDNAGFSSAPAVRVFPALEAVRRRLTFHDLFALGTETLHLGKPSGIAVGSLVVDGNASLESLGPATFQVRHRGPVTVTGNPNLCDSVVQSFLDALPGWRGVATVGGNKPGC